MEGLLIVIVLVVVAVVGFVMFGRARSSPEGQRVETLVRSELGGSQPSSAPREPTVETLRPGDAISFWDGQDSTVDCVLECEEAMDGRHTHWRWNLLRDGRLLETAPDGNVLYPKGSVFHQGTAEYEQLTGEPAAGGVLKTFEARVRAGSVGSNPMYWEYGGERFRVASTGTFAARPLGAPPTAEVWRDLSDNPGDNVYFELEAESGKQGLGIWTTHILLLVGDPLQASDVRSIFPGQASPA